MFPKELCLLPGFLTNTEFCVLMSPDHITAGAYNRDIDKRLARIWSGYARLVSVQINAFLLYNKK